MFSRAAGDRAPKSWRAVTAVVSSVCALVVTAHRPAVAQSPSRRAQSTADSARLAADLFFRAVADERWDAAAAMVDTMVIRRMVIERSRRRSTSSPARDTMTIDDFMRDDPNKPRAVAEYELKRYREQTAKIEMNPMTHEFAGVRNLDELRTLSALQATARFIQAQDSRVQMREMMRTAGCADSLVTSMPFTIHRILGVALANDTVAYVLHDEGRSLGPVLGIVFEPMVMQLRLRRDGWRLVPGYGLLRRMNSGIGFVSCGPNTPGRPPG